jgi:hypothetical protein
VHHLVERLEIRVYARVEEIVIGMTDIALEASGANQLVFDRRAVVRIILQNVAGAAPSPTMARRKVRLSATDSKVVEGSNVVWAEVLWKRVLLAR